MNLKLHAVIESWPLVAPFRITGYEFKTIDVLLVMLEGHGFVGRGEAAGVYYKTDTPARMIEQIELLRVVIERGIQRVALQRLLPPCGARNALDCALWDLDAKRTGQRVWQLAGLQNPRPIVTTFGCGADTPENMAAAARAFTGARAIKLKLTGDAIDAERIRAVRESLPEVWLSVDANQGFTRPFLERLMVDLVELRVSLIEQPFPVGEESLLDGFDSPIPIAADESAQSQADVYGLVDRFDVVNIKLDKCGGLTEGLEIARTARELGLRTMVGNMMGTSLSVAPAFLLGQMCSVVDLDGPVFLKNDRSDVVSYESGLLSCPAKLWGGGADALPER